MVSEIRIDAFDYPLPDRLIPKHPLEKRDECRLLVWAGRKGLYHRKFKELASLLPPSSFLVCNDAKVIRARMIFHKESGAGIEIFLLEPITPSDYALNFQSENECEWKCLVGNLKKWKEGDISLKIQGLKKEISVTLYATRIGNLKDGGVAVKFHWDNPEFIFSQIVEAAGNIPIPPYLHRDSEERDNTDYQTVYATNQGSVAAPTAGLHFTPEVFEDLEAHGVTVDKLTLHVGAGTFKPVKSETIGNHEMHSERFRVSLSFLKNLYENKKAGYPVIAVGTTSVRTLESLPYMGEAIKRGMSHPFQLNQWEAYEGKNDFDTVEALDNLIKWMEETGNEEIHASTSIMIAPGFNWRITDGMVTNFHQPKSTLLLLVSSFIMKDGNSTLWKKIYEEALKENYRFLSYGDASLLIR